MTGHVANIGAELTESQAAVRVFLSAGALVLLGLLLLLLTISWWRGTRPEPPALGPLEVMGDRRWATAAESERRRLLEEFRPVGAEPSNLFVEPQPVDLSVLAREAPPTFEDLRDPLEDPEALEIAAELASAADPDGSDSGAGVDAGDDVSAEVEVEVEVVGEAAGDPETEVEVAVEPSGDLGAEVEVEVDGTVAMEVPAFEALPTSPLQEAPFVQQDLDLDLDDHDDEDLDDEDLDDEVEVDGDGDGPSGRHETVAMVTPIQHVSPNAGE